MYQKIEGNELVVLSIHVAVFHKGVTIAEQMQLYMIQLYENILY
jgi:hypothetical protein